MPIVLACLLALPKCYQKLKVRFEAKKCTKIVAQFKKNGDICNVEMKITN